MTAPKLNPDQIQQIKSAYAKGEDRATIAARYGITVSGVQYHTSMIKKGQLDPVDFRTLLGQAACRGYSTETFFPASSDLQGIRTAKAICAECPVARSCLDWAVQTGSVGIWGGRALGLKSNGSRSEEEAA